MHRLQRLLKQINTEDKLGQWPCPASVAAEATGKKDVRRNGPLVGVRVIDLSSVISGPWATSFLADQGAEVIKVEAPGAPDMTRGLGPNPGSGLG